MSTRLRCVYESMKSYSFKTQASMCQDLIKKLKSAKKTDLADLFVEALRENGELDGVDAPFISEQMLENRCRTANEREKDRRARNGTIRVTDLLTEYDHVQFVHDGEVKHFRFVEREVPHLRGHPNESGRNRAWIDYIARAGTRTILGEIKHDTDQNPFYAFIQLLTYLSEIATDQQIQRLMRDPLLGEDSPIVDRFDLHILLTCFNKRSKRWKIREETQELVLQFKAALAEKYPHDVEVLGNVFCLHAELKELEQRVPLNCCWMV